MTTMLKALAKKYARSQKGNVLVEFALILPMFVLLVFGTMTFSIALYDKTVLTMATREGARAGALSDSTSDAQDAADDYNDLLISFAGGATPVFHASKSGDVMTVTATYTYSGLSFPGLPATIDLTAETSMRVEP